ncbi:MAG: proton-conducting transporter membrane subunit [Pirellulaceae bacterium]|nr:proton-conducting transporter membrane subunit [Pirellulaceae bacterium]
MTWDDFLPLVTLLTALIPAAIIFLLPEERIRTRTTVNMAGAVLKLAIIGLMLWGVFHEHRYEFRFPIMQDLEIVLRADALAMFFITLSGVLWFVTTIYAIAYLEGSPHRGRFFGFFSLCVGATVGIALAGNLFTFVTFYELLTLSTYPLVVHRGTATALRAGRVYLAYTLAGGALLLLGAAWLHVLLPSVDFNGGASLAGLGTEHHASLRIIFALLIVGLGVKAALVPLHGWLPQAMVAPAPVSALLHAVAVVKAGAFGIVRVVYDVYGIDFAQQLALTTPLALFASATIVYGSVRALFQDDLKRRLAFSTISQVSYIVLGVAIIGPSATIGGVVHLVHQGLMKITLFFCAGNLAETLGIHKISEMHGVGRRMPWTMAAFTAGAFGMIGVPPLAGFISKWYLGVGAVEAGQTWVLLVLAASSALNAAYFLPILFIVWFRDKKVSGTFCRNGPQGASHKRFLTPFCERHGVETSWGLLLPPLVTAALLIITGLFAGAPFSPLQWAALIVERAYGRAVIPQGLSDGPALLSFHNSLLLLTLAVPLVMTCLLLWHRHRRLVLWLASVAAAPAVAVAIWCQPGVTVDLPWLLLHMRLGLDATGQGFLLFTALLWLFAGVYARGYLANDPRIHHFFAYFLLTMTGNLGLVLSHDMVSFYLFFALMSFSSYGLIVHHGDAEAIRAGRIYMVLVVIGEILLFVGMLLATVACGSLSFDQGVAGVAASPARHVILGLFLVGFGIKAGVAPLHVWLPLAHPAAPTPASAVLSGAMIKAGLLGWIRFLPLGEVAFPDWGNLCLIFGLVTAFYGAIIGVTQRNAKAVLAYSSISQMGLLTLGVGAGLLVPSAWPAICSAVLIYAMHHGLSKGCLFLSVGLFPHAENVLWRRRLLQAGLVFPALALAGAPLTTGAVSKVSLKYALSSLPDHWTATLGVLLPLAAVGTTLLMARFVYLIWPSPGRDDRPPAPAALLSWCGLLSMVVLAAWWLPTTDRSSGSWEQLVATISWDNLWPVLLGSVVAWVGWRLCQSQRGMSLPSVPAGDVLVPALGVIHSMTTWWLSLFPRWQENTSWSFKQSYGTFIDRIAGHVSGRIRSAETMLTSWPLIGSALTIIVLTGLLLSHFLSL